MKKSSIKAGASERFADALSPIKLDEVGQFMVHAALMVELGHLPTEAREHAIKALAACRPGPENPMHMGYFDAVARLCRAAGYDQSGYSVDEVIDILVAAAYWEV